MPKPKRANTNNGDQTHTHVHLLDDGHMQRAQRALRRDRQSHGFIWDTRGGWVAVCPIEDSARFEELLELAREI